MPPQPKPLNASTPPKVKWRSSLPLDATLVVLWLGGGMLALYLKHTQLFAGFDGGYMRDLARRQFELQVPLFSASVDLFQGLGDVFFPINLRLFPAFIAASPLGSGIAAKVVTYGCVLAELSLAIIFFGRSLGASRPVSIAAALMTCIALFPFYRSSLIHMIAALSPTIGTLIAAATAIAAAFLRFGRKNWLADLPFAFLIFALLAWSLLATSTSMILAGPFLLLCGVSGILAGTGRSERYCKIGLFLAAAALLVATGPALYLAGLVFETAASTFPLELGNDRATLYFASILFHWNSVGPAGPLLVILAVAGGLQTILERRHRTLRIFAITLLTYLGTRLTFAVLTIVFDFWRGPSPLYFEFFVIPLYAIFAVLFLARVLDRMRHALGWRPPTDTQIEAGLVAAGVVLTIGFAAGTRSPDYGFQYPPKPTPFTELLAEETGMRPGSEFRGRTANMTGRSIDRGVTWLDLHGRDHAMSQQIGNEMRVAGLHAFGIPGFFEYGPTITPAFYVTTTRLLGSPNDMQMRSVGVLRDIEPRILAMLGVRFVITDAPFDGAARLRARLPVKGETLYLYEIARPNLGDYSPTVVRKPFAAADIIERLGNADFDPSREIIADVPGNAEGLVPARSSRLIFDGVSLRLEADSPGRSVLLLPLEFSRCLKVTSIRSGEPILFRANLLETGILFSERLDVTVSIRTGVFLDPGCRLQDYRDVTALRIGEVPPRSNGRDRASGRV